MKFSLKLENACRVMIQLAGAYDGRRVSRVEDLAQREHVSPSFMLQILNELRRAGMVVSKRGKFGGYMLARPPAEITLREIVVAIDGSTLETDVRRDGESAARLAAAWREIAASIDELLAATSVADLAARGQEGGQMFYI
jgi:Rrf2 family transcriptional regulator, cysteine metabolism repressor